MVHLNRRQDGTRAVESVAELVGYEGGEYKLNYLYELDENLKLKPTGNKLVQNIKMRKAKKEKYNEG